MAKIQTGPGKGKANPRKPYPDFPLTPHPAKRWCKKIRGRIHYFGPIDDPDSALKEYLRVKDYLHAGLRPPENRDGLSVRDLVNAFLTDRQHRVDAGELRRRTFRDYHDTCSLIVRAFHRERLVEDLRPEDFTKLRGEFAKGRNPVTVGNLVRMTRSVFKFAYDSCLIDTPIRFGPTFRPPAKRIIRAIQQAGGSRMLEANQIHLLLDAASVPMRAMVLLGVNCGFGNADIGNLPQRALDQEGGWITYPRSKTAIPRRCKIWRETSDAVEQALKVRPAAKKEEDDKLIFLTRIGHCWFNDGKANPLSREFRKLLDTTELYRRGLGFYSLRRSFETVAGGTCDQVAVDYVMGHSDPSIGAVYRQRIEDERLVRVADHVHGWLFSPEGHR